MSLMTSTSVPLAIVERFDPFSADYLADPYPTLRELRETAPVFYSVRARSLGSSRATWTFAIS